MHTSNISPPYPWGRMFYNLLFLMSLGTLYAYAAWSNKFHAMKGPYQNWTQSQLGLVYSFGTFGAFSTPVGGYVYGRYGAKIAYIFAFLLVLLGFAGLYILLQVPSIVPTRILPLVVGLFYYIEEQGSSTFYMGILCDTMLHFPPKSMSMSMGLVAFGYSTSSMATGLLVHVIPMSLPVFWAIVLCLIAFFAFGRICVLGNLGHHKVEKDGEENCDDVSLSELVRSKHFLKFQAAALAGAPCVMVIGFVKSLGTAAGGGGTAITEVAFICNAAGRVVSGMVYDRFRQIPSERVLGGIIVVLAMAFFLLVVQSFAWPSYGLAVVGSSLVIFGFGCTATVWGVYCKDYFKASTCGVVIGMAQFALAIWNFIFNIAVAPDTSGPHGFTVTFLTSALACTAVAAVFFLTGPSCDPSEAPLLRSSVGGQILKEKGCQC